MVEAPNAFFSRLTCERGTCRRKFFGTLLASESHLHQPAERLSVCEIVDFLSQCLMTGEAQRMAAAASRAPPER